MIHLTSTQQLIIVDHIRKQKGRGPHLQMREIFEPDQRGRRCQLQSCGDEC